MPPRTPATTPVDVLIVATLVLELFHTPPDTVLVSVVVELSHTVAVPLMVATGLTVTVVDLVQPVESVYAIVAVPALVPHTTPLEEPTVATDVMELLHTPPDVASPSVVQLPAHILLTPVMVAGTALTVKTAVVKQPVDNV